MRGAELSWNVRGASTVIPKGFVPGDGVVGLMMTIIAPSARRLAQWLSSTAVYRRLNWPQRCSFDA